MQVQAKVGDGEPVVVDYDFGDDLAGMVDNFTESVTFNKAKSAMVVDLQAFIRRQINADKNPADIQEAANGWKPSDQTRTKKSAKDKVVGLLEGMSEEDRAELIREMQAA